MSQDEDSRELSAFEQRTRALLEESLTRVDGRVRSRLTQARHAALAQLEENSQASWSSRHFAPLSAAAAATIAAVAFLAWHQPRPHHPRLNEGGGQASFEDLDLLADGEAFELLQDDGAFYEWAAAQDDSADGESG